MKVSRGCSAAPILRIEGHLTFDQSFAPLRESISHLLDRRERNMAIDLSAVEKVDSSGIGELVHAFNRVAALGGRLFILTPPPKVAELFRVAGLGSILGLGPAPRQAFEDGTLQQLAERQSNKS